jgi:hypothetical protein
LLWFIEFSHIGSGAKAGREVHLKVAFEVENDGYDDDELVDLSHGPPMLRRDGVRVRRVAIDGAAHRNPVQKDAGEE